MSFFQLVIAAIALAFWTNAVIKFFKREKHQSFFKFIANTLVWFSIAIFSLFPALTHQVSLKLGFGESLNTLIFIGFIIVFMILFKIINIVERIERNISEIVRKEALSRLNDKK
jgi:hypothetical protein